MSRVLSRSLPVAACFVLAAALFAACDFKDPRSTAAPATPYCEVADELPGAAPWPAETRSAVAATALPRRAIHAGRKICNRLALEAGAFAQQHAADPVDWRSWSPATLEEARTLDRPLLVLSGFAACGSCEALTRSTLGDAELAAQINAKFVPVLVDHDERPDVDAYLMLATEVVTGGGGWPALVFLDAGARPFEAESWGAAAAEGRDFSRAVIEITRRLALGGGTIPDRAEATLAKMGKRVDVDTDGEPPSSVEVSPALRDYIAESFDPAGGSFGRTPLFPRAPVLGFLLASTSQDIGAEGGDADGKGEHAEEHGAAGADADVPAKGMAGREMAGFVLAKLRDSALADPVGGGFFRFARKAGWVDPSFEKLAADNAALASVYLDAAAATGSAQFRDTAVQTLDFLLRELRVDSGGFAAGLAGSSRDAAGSPCDGCYYSLGEVSRLDLARSPEAMARAAAGRRLREPPDRDDRVLADANGVVISALVRASKAGGDVRYREAAVAAARFVDAKLRDGGKVYHFVEPDGRRAADGYLADHAAVATALLDVAEIDASADWMGAARAIADEIVRRFSDEAVGGFFQTGTGAETMPLRFKPTLDAAVPSGNSAAAELFVRLAQVTDEERYRTLARRSVAAFSRILRLRPLAMPQMALVLEAVERMEPPAAVPAAVPARKAAAAAAAGPQAVASGPVIAPPQLEPAPAVHP